MVCCVVHNVALESKFQLILLTIDHPHMSISSCHCRGGHLEVVKYLIFSAKANANAQGSNGKTPLHYASE